MQAELSWTAAVIHLCSMPRRFSPSPDQAGLSTCLVSASRRSCNAPTHGQFERFIHARRRSEPVQKRVEAIAIEHVLRDALHHFVDCCRRCQLLQRWTQSMSPLTSNGFMFSAARFAAAADCCCATAFDFESAAAATVWRGAGDAAAADVVRDIAAMAVVLCEMQQECQKSRRI